MSYLPQYNSGSQYGSQNKVQPKPSSPNGVQPKPTSWTGQGQQDVPYTGGHYNQQVPRQYAQQQPDSLLPQQPQQQQQWPGFSLNTSIQPQNVYPQSPMGGGTDWLRAVLRMRNGQMSYLPQYNSSYLPQYNSGSQYGSQNKVQPKPTSWTGQGQQDVPYTGGHYNQQVPRQYAQQQPDSLLPQQPQQQQQRPGFSLNTSIQPQNVYPQQYTNQAANLAATNVPAYNDLVAGRQRPGVSVQSPMTQAGMGADIGSALAQAMMARSGVQQQHGFANAQNQLGGQTARDQEARGLMQLYMGNLGAAQNQGLMQDQGLLQLLSMIFGMA